MFPTNFPSILWFCQNPHRGAPCPCLVWFCVARIRLPNGRLPYNFKLSVNQSQGVFQKPLDRAQTKQSLSRDHVSGMRPADWSSARRPLPVGDVYNGERQVVISVRRVFSCSTIVVLSTIISNSAFWIREHWRTTGT